jgi:hypothetical protein
VLQGGRSASGGQLRRPLLRLPRPELLGDPPLYEIVVASIERLLNGRYESKRVIIPVDCQHMTNTELRDKAHAAALRHLQELVAALDRRVPQIERAGEIDIAHDTAVLKAKALERIAELERPA